RPGGTGELRRGQGGPRRADPQRRPRARPPPHHLQRRRPPAYRDGNDRRSVRRLARPGRSGRSPPSAWGRSRMCGRHHIPVLGARCLRDRCRGTGRRRPGHGPLTEPFQEDSVMDRAEALDTIKEVAAEVLSVDPDQVTETARFKEDLDADSLDLVELVMGLEERFDIEVPEDDLEGVTTIGQAVDLVLTKVGS